MAVSRLLLGVQRRSRVRTPTALHLLHKTTFDGQPPPPPLPPCHHLESGPPPWPFLANPTLREYRRSRQSLLPLPPLLLPPVLHFHSTRPAFDANTEKPTWIATYLPSRLRPFALLARLDKPIGTWLLAWPCMWSIALAAPESSLPDFKMLALFGVGAILLRGAGCTVNDLLDRDIDCKVERTRLRPIASKALTPFQGLSFLGLQLLLGLGILLQLNNFSQVLGASSLLLVGSYPLMKRWTFWPQAFLGLTFNWGALLGWAAIRGSLDLSVLLPLYLSGVCWTLVYDTIYAHQDKEDDVKVGVKSTALLFGDRTPQWLSGFSAICLASLSLAGYNMNLGWPFYLFILGGAGHLYWQVFTVQLGNRRDCNSKFMSNKWFGALVFAGIVSGKLVLPPGIMD